MNTGGKEEKVRVGYLDPFLVRGKEVVCDELTTSFEYNGLGSPLSKHGWWSWKDYGEIPIDLDIHPEQGRFLERINIVEGLEEVRGPICTRYKEMFEFRHWTEWVSEGKTFLVIFPVYFDSEFILGIQNYSLGKYENLLTYIRTTRKAKIIFQLPWEGFEMEEQHFDSVYRFAQKHNLPRECVVFMSPLEKVPGGVLRKINHVGYPYFHLFHNYGEVSDSTLKEYILSNRTNKNIKYSILNYNGKPKIFRGALYGMVKHYLRERGISTMIDPGYWETPVDRLIEGCIDMGYTHKESLECLSHMRYLNTENEIVLSGGVNNSDRDIVSSDLNRKNCFVELYSEVVFENGTEFIGQTVGLTEKTFKPIISLKPFIACANQGHLKHLRELGFKTFSRWWDEGYDEEPDKGKRMDMIRKLVEYISTLDSQTMYTMLQEMESTLVHNFNLFVSMRSSKEEVLGPFYRLQSEYSTVV